MKIYDLIIIGAGPAGISAGIYAKNFGMDCLIIGETSGGTINTAYKIENYPGIFGVTGKELGEKFKEHADHLKVQIMEERVDEILKDEKGFKIVSGGKEYFAKSVILAMGTEAKKIEIKDIQRFEEKGASYCSKNCVSLFNDQEIVIVGGANAAVMGAVMLAKETKKVYLIYRGEELRADAIWIERVKKLKNVEIIYGANITEARGDDRLEEVILDNGKTLKVSGLIIEAGSVPNNILLKDVGIKVDEHGYVEVDKAQRTSISGVFAAGDITIGSNGFRQVVTAVSEGAIAALEAFKYLNNK